MLFWPILERRAIDGDSESGAPLGLGTESLLWVDIASEISHHCISVQALLDFVTTMHACPQPVSEGMFYIEYCVGKIRHLVLCTTTTTDGRQYLLNIFCMSTETDRLSTGMEAAYQPGERPYLCQTYLISCFQPK